VVKFDFITKIPRTMKQHDSIMVVVVDKLTKDAHFILVNLTHKATNIADIYMREITKLHGVPKEFVSNRDPKFTSKFWKGLFKEFGMNLNFNTSYHLKSNGKTKRVNQVIEDMSRMYVMDKPSKW
jgi:transposase InsO family protein